MDVENVKHEVIEGRLLMALRDEGQVAIVLSETDINDLIWALRGNPADAERLLPGMIQLRDEAFGKKS